MQTTIFLAAIVVQTTVFLQCPSQPVGDFAPPGNTLVSFERPDGMNVFWLTREGGKTALTTKRLEAPGRTNFAQAAIQPALMDAGEATPPMAPVPRRTNCRPPALGPASTDCTRPEMSFTPKCWAPWKFSQP
jgi:hypothetical protein